MERSCGWRAATDGEELHLKGVYTRNTHGEELHMEGVIHGKDSRTENS